MEVDYIKEVKRQFNLEPVTYFIFRRGTRFSLEELQIYLDQIDGLENEMLKNNHKYIQDKRYKRPLITVVLFVDQNRECKVKALSVRSQKDEFDAERGINEAARHTLRLLKGREETPVRRPYAVRTLINCCMNTTCHAEEYPKLDLFEQSLICSKKKVVDMVQNGNASSTPCFDAKYPPINVNLSLKSTLFKSPFLDKFL